jgi:hypothetical protein
VLNDYDFKPDDDSVTFIIKVPKGDLLANYELVVTYNNYAPNGHKDLLNLIEAMYVNRQNSSFNMIRPARSLAEPSVITINAYFRNSAGIRVPMFMDGIVKYMTMGVYFTAMREGRDDESKGLNWNMSLEYVDDKEALARKAMELGYGTSKLREDAETMRQVFMLTTSYLSEEIKKYFENEGRKKYLAKNGSDFISKIATFTNYLSAIEHEIKQHVKK